MGNESPIPFRYPLYIRPTDVVGAHVNNGTYLNYFDAAREALFGLDTDFALDDSDELVSPRASFTDLIGAERFFVISQNFVEYRRPLDYRADPVSINVWITRIGRSSMDVAFEVTDPTASNVYAAARSTMVLTTDSGATSTQIDDRLRAVLSGWLGAAPVFHA